MIISLVTATISYVVGVFIIVAVLDPTELHSDLTPVATAAETFFDWLPQPLGLILIVTAAIAAFASTGNAGLMSASRYPLAMARDRLLSPVLARIGRFHTPVPAIVLTGGLMIVCIVALDVEGIAKLASAFQLLIFLLINVAVIVMRESRIQAYDPGFKSPLYPWMQVFGIAGPILLVALMGWMAILFTLTVTILCLLWYRFYARDRVNRDGAIYHWFERLGRRRYSGLEPELRGIIRERGLRDEDPFDEVVTRANVFDIEEGADYEQVVQRAATSLAARVPLTAEKIAEEFMRGTRTGATPVTGGVALPHIQVADIEHPELVIARSTDGLFILGGHVSSADADPSERHGFEATHSGATSGEHDTAARKSKMADDSAAAHAAKARGPNSKCAYALFFLASPADNPGLHLRILAKIAEHVDKDTFMARWLSAADEIQLKQLLLRDDRFLSLRLERDQPTAVLIDQPLGDYKWPEECLVALIQRQGQTLIPHGDTILAAGDRITVIGTPEGIDQLREAFKEAPAGAD